MFLTESNVVALASILFAIALFKPIKKFVLSFLDEKIQSAIKDIEDASKIRAEAEEYLAASKAKLDESQANALEIIEKAKEKSEAILRNVENQVNLVASKKLSDSLARIAQQEQQILSDLKVQTVEATMKLLEESVIKELSKDAQMSLVNQSLKKANKIVN